MQLHICKFNILARSRRKQIFSWGLLSAACMQTWTISLVTNIEEGFIQKNRAKVVAALWGTEFIKFLAGLAILHHDDMKEWIWTAPGCYEEKDEFLLFFKLSWCKVANATGNLINSVLQTTPTTFAFSSVYIILLMNGKKKRENTRNNR